MQRPKGEFPRPMRQLEKSRLTLGRYGVVGMSPYVKDVRRRVKIVDILSGRRGGP